MKKRNKFLAMGLCAALPATTLAGCGGSAGGGGNAGGDSAGGG
ncbi:sugar ABC transporter substrate-binding protein, partial [Klebsiella oxytoca]